MKASQNIPVLRFPEFEGEWKHLKVIDFAPLQRGYDLPSYKIVEGEYPVVFSNGILKTHKEYMAIAPGVITGRSGTIGKVNYVEKNYWPHNTSLWVTSFKGNNPKFVYYFYDRFNLARFGTGSGVPTLNRNDIHNQKIKIPYLREQQKIAFFLTTVDDKIQQLTKKKYLLEQYKKGVMQKIFKQEIRFRNDDEKEFPEWEEKKLSEVFSRITTKNTELNSNVLTVSAQQGLINQEEFFNKSVAAKDLTGYYLIQKGDFAYNKSYSNGFPMGATKRLKKYDKGVVSTLYICFRIKKNHVSEFYEHYFDSGRINKEIHKIAQEGARNHGLLNISVVEYFDSVKIPRPSFPEQQKIANFLSAIDAKIEQVNIQLEKTKAFKKGLLQQMFV